MRKRLFLLLLLPLALAACNGGAPSGNSGGAVQGDEYIRIELIALNHPPIRPAVEEVETLVAAYGDKVALQTYDFDTPDGAAFAEEHALTEHTPLAIFINGQMEFELEGRTIKFYGFPQGQGTGMVADGTWTLDDLRAVLDQMTN